MLKRAMIAMMLLAVPTLAYAQGGGQRGGQRGQRGPGMMGAPGPLAIVLEKKVDLALTEEQVAKVTEMEAALTEKNAPHLEKIREMRESGEMPDRAVMMEIQQAIRANNQEAHEALEDVLNAEQLELANKLIAEAAPRGRRGGRGGR
jgi:hypothetical protein